MKENPPPYSVNPAPPGFHVPPPGVGTAHTVIVTTTPIVVGSERTRLICPYCHESILTSIESESNTKTHLFAILLCLFGCWPCFFMPYCIDSCQNQKHTCPNCKAFLGTFTN